MVAGLNVLFRIWQMNEKDDDYVGGASVSGTCFYDNVLGSIQQNPTSQVFLEQGLEAHKVFQILLVPASLQLSERDELELIQPLDHWYINNRFRVIGVQPARNNPRDERNYLIIQAHRKVISHDKQ